MLTLRTLCLWNQSRTFWPKIGETSLWSQEGDSSDQSVEKYFGAARLWPWEIAGVRKVQYLLRIMLSDLSRTEKLVSWISVSEAAVAGTVGMNLISCILFSKLNETTGHNSQGMQRSLHLFFFLVWKKSCRFCLLHHFNLWPLTVSVFSHIILPGFLLLPAAARSKSRLTLARPALVCIGEFSYAMLSLLWRRAQARVWSIVVTTGDGQQLVLTLCPAICSAQLMAQQSTCFSLILSYITYIRLGWDHLIRTDASSSMAGDIRGLVDVASISSCPGRPSRVLVSRAGFRFSPLVPLFMPTLKSVPSRWPSFRTCASLFLQPGCLALGEKVKLPSTASSMWKRSVLAKVTLLQAQLVPGWRWLYSLFWILFFFDFETKEAWVKDGWRNCLWRGVDGSSVTETVRTNLIF